MISKIVLGLFSAIILFQVYQVYADEELSIITVDFVSGSIIDLDENPQMIRVNVQIQNYNPQDGYHLMQITRVSDGEIIKDSEFYPKFVGGEDDTLWEAQILHYIEPGQNDEDLIGDYGLRIYSEYGSSESVSTFSVIKSSMPVTVTQNAVEESVIPTNSTDTEELVIPEESDKIPSWVHDIFVWYANDSVSEDELLAAIEYLINEGTIDINSD